MHAGDLPNLFIIGAPKCGTTSMFHWLAEHPQICASYPKETWFFAGNELDHRDIRPNHREDDLSEYLSCFGAVDDNTRIKMEGSTHYLYSEPALAFLSGISPKPRLIVQLRNPATRIWSHFNFIKQQSESSIRISFHDFVDALLTSKSKSYSKFTREPWAQHLLENQLSYSNYYLHLRNWLNQFPRGRIKILILEDLIMRKRRNIGDVAAWLRIDAAYYDEYEFEKKNVTRSPVAEEITSRLAIFARIFPRPVSVAAKTIVDNALSSIRIKKSTKDKKALADLENYFAKPNELLMTEFGLDLASWQI